MMDVQNVFRNSFLYLTENKLWTRPNNTSLLKKKKNNTLIQCSQYCISTLRETEITLVFIYFFSISKKKNACSFLPIKNVMTSK